MNLGMPEIIVIVIVILLVFGPNRVPELSRALGKSIRDFRKAMSDLEDQIEAEVKDKAAQAPASPESATPAASPATADASPVSPQADEKSPADQAQG